MEGPRILAPGSRLAVASCGAMLRMNAHLAGMTSMDVTMLPPVSSRASAGRDRGVDTCRYSARDPGPSATRGSNMPISM
jgi:hypothetical protein